MNINENVLKNDEKAVLKLRDLYGLYGYSCFKMNKFVEYDLYGQNKEFLISDGVITFTDTDGKLMALKPDVTLSIVKNSADVLNGVKRLYYNENVYRISERTHHYKEIMQTGLECFGDLGVYNLCEVIGLATKSLGIISEESVLSVSHLGVISALLEGEDQLGHARRDIMKRLEEKNEHELRFLCEKCGISEEKTRFITSLTKAYGEPKSVVSGLMSMTSDGQIISALKEFETVVSACEKTSPVKIRADFSLTGDMAYYNGLIFRGYVRGIPTPVLSGGQYDMLMKKMGRSEKAIGFAVYPEALERLEKNREYDFDVLVLYDDGTKTEDIIAKTEERTKAGKSVSVRKTVPEMLRFRETVDLSR